MGHTTYILTKLAKEISPNPSSREMDMLLSTGEGVSIALLAMALQAQGCDAVSMNAMQVGIITEKVHSKAKKNKLNMLGNCIYMLCTLKRNTENIPSFFSFLCLERMS